jgi:hypothetical protein
MSRASAYGESGHAARGSRTVTPAPRVLARHKDGELLQVRRSGRPANDARSGPARYQVARQFSRRRSRELGDDRAHLPARSAQTDPDQPYRRGRRHCQKRGMLIASSDDDESISILRLPAAGAGSRTSTATGRRPAAGESVSAFTESRPAPGAQRIVPPGLVTWTESRSL